MVLGEGTEGRDGGQEPGPAARGWDEAGPAHQASQLSQGWAVGTMVRFSASTTPFLFIEKNNLEAPFL